ncbi:hypothetical protein HK102_007729 [Quaeritorhiza haematococci]|nr:hypothetical protein HK102_007729 [Quaeritorhiza haematococci]
MDQTCRITADSNLLLNFKNSQGIATPLSPPIPTAWTPSGYMTYSPHPAAGGMLMMPAGTPQPVVSGVATTAYTGSSTYAAATPGAGNPPSAAMSPTSPVYITSGLPPPQSYFVPSSATTPAGGQGAVSGQWWAYTWPYGMVPVAAAPPAAPAAGPPTSPVLAAPQVYGVGTGSSSAVAGLGLTSRHHPAGSAVSGNPPTAQTSTQPYAYAYPATTVIPHHMQQQPTPMYDMGGGYMMAHPAHQPYTTRSVPAVAVAADGAYYQPRAASTGSSATSSAASSDSTVVASGAAVPKADREKIGEEGFDGGFVTTT